MALELELKPVSHITADALGEPGQRVFYLQARRGTQTVTLMAEKEQVQALAIGVEELLAQVESRHGRGEMDEETVSPYDLLLQEPLDAAFRVGQMGLGYDEEEDLLILIIHEMVSEEGEEGATARFWATRGRMRALCHHAREVVKSGRPICPLCGQPMDPTGHFCPPSNGHNRRTDELS